MRFAIALTLAMLSSICAAHAQGSLHVTATFSILGDLVKNVGGSRVAVDSLVGPNGDAHVYTPPAADVKKLGDTRLIVANGLGFEGWLDRLFKASGTKAPIVIATRGIKTRTSNERPHVGPDIDEGKADPHAWQSIPNVKLYVANIRDALIAADPSGKSVYDDNASKYLQQLDELDRDIRRAVAAVAPERRRIVSNHSAFGYFQDEYKVMFLSPTGLSTDAEPSAKDVAAIITSIKQSKASAVFLENVADPRLMQRIAAEAGVNIGGTLYGDALTDEKGEAPSYLALMRHNVTQISRALTN